MKIDIVDSSHAAGAKLQHWINFHAWCVCNIMGALTKAAASYGTNVRSTQVNL